MKYKYKDFNVYTRRTEDGKIQFFYEFIFTINSSIKDKYLVKSHIFEEKKQMSHKSWSICEGIVIKFISKRQLKFPEIEEIMQPLGGICDKPVTGNWIVHKD